MGNNLKSFNLLTHAACVALSRTISSKDVLTQGFYFSSLRDPDCRKMHRIALLTCLLTVSLMNQGNRQFIFDFFFFNLNFRTFVILERIFWHLQWGGPMKEPSSVTYMIWEWSNMLRNYISSLLKGKRAPQFHSEFFPKPLIWCSYNMLSLLETKYQLTKGFLCIKVTFISRNALFVPAPFLFTTFCLHLFR